MGRRFEVKQKCVSPNIIVIGCPQLGLSGSVPDLYFSFTRTAILKRLSASTPRGKGAPGIKRNRPDGGNFVLLKIILIVGANPGKETIITNEAILTRLHALLREKRMEIARERAASLPGGETIHVAIHCSGASRNTALPRIRATETELKPEPYINCRVTFRKNWLSLRPTYFMAYRRRFHT